MSKDISRWSFVNFTIEAEGISIWSAFLIGCSSGTASSTSEATTSAVSTATYETGRTPKFMGAMNKAQKIDTVPDENFLRERLLAAGGAVTLDEIHTAPGLMKEALRYHAYMRHRLFLTRILPLAGVDLLDYVDLPLK